MIKLVVLDFDDTLCLTEETCFSIENQAAGLHFIAILESGLRTREDFKATAVDYFATTLPEAFNYIMNA